MYVTKRYKIIRIGEDFFLVLNALTGAINVFSRAGIEALKRLTKKGFGRAKNIPKEFEKTKLFFDSAKAERYFFLSVCEKAQKQFYAKAPYSFTFILNTGCNFNCIYCFEPFHLRQTKLTLSREQVDQAFAVIDKIVKKYPYRQKPGVEIFGGETLLPGSRKILEYILRQLSKRRLSTSIQTNGYNLLEFIDLVRRQKKQINSFQITLDGPPKVHDKRRILGQGRGGTFDRIVAGIDRLYRLRLGIKINIRMNIDRGNLKYLKPMAKYFQKKGWAKDKFFNFVAAPVDNRSGHLRGGRHLISWGEAFKRIFPLSRDQGKGPYDISLFKVVNYLRAYLSSAVRGEKLKTNLFPKTMFCEANAAMLYVFHPDGHIYPCPETVGVQKYALGTYFPKFKLNNRRLKLWGRQTILKKKKCRECNIATFCGGGCALGALTKNGSMSRPECDSAPEILEAYLSSLKEPIR